MISCRATRRRLLEVVRQTASDAVRLEIESHLENCPGCRIERARWELVGHLKVQPTQRLSLAAERRIIAHLVQTPPRALVKQTIASHPGSRRLTVAVGLAVVLVAAGALVFSFRHDAARRDSGGLAEGQWLEEADRGTISFGGARVDYDSGTTMIVHPARRQLTLRSGQVEVDVTEGRPGRFRVATSAFIVEVLGTRFVVTPEGVHTLRGHVRVLDLKGRELVVLNAGESWTNRTRATNEGEATAVTAAAALSSDGAAPSAPAPSVTPSEVEPVTPPASARVVPSSLPQPTAPSLLEPPTSPESERAVPSLLDPLAPRAPVRAPGPAVVVASAASSRVRVRLDPTRASLSRPTAVTEFLSLTRAALAEGDAAGARTWIERARAEQPNESEAATADLLEADAWLVAREPEQAISAYRGVFLRRASAPEGETAAFAVAQLLAERADASEATAALSDYLAHYPGGRFVREVRERLQRLQSAR